MAKEYVLKNEYTYPNAIVKVYSPVLTEEERTKRMKHLKKETERFMKLVIKEGKNLK